MENIAISDYISLLTNVAALALSIVAIWLSITFFKMSSSLAEDSKEAAKGIGASVDRLEKLFDKLYADTFSMMKDTVSDMRRHIWPEEASEDQALAEEVEERTEKKLNSIRASFEGELSQILSKQMEQSDRLNSVKELLDRAIISTKEVTTEVREETIREHIIDAIGGRRRIQFYELIDEIDANPVKIFRELQKMEGERLLMVTDDFPKPHTMIHVSPTLDRASRANR